MRWPSVLPATLLAAVCPAQQPAEPASGPDPAIRSFDAWLESYERGGFRLVRHDLPDQGAIAEVDRLFARVAQVGTLAAAGRLLRAASTLPEPPGAKSSTDRVTFHRELMPWKVRALAVRHLAAMRVEGLEDWLVKKLGALFGRAPAAAEARERAAVMRVLARRRSPLGVAALLRASRSLPGEERVHAVNALAELATPETVPHYLELLRDVEPNVRIAALNGLGHALSPLTDETTNRPATPEELSLRDRAIARMKAVLLHDRVWQVRAAAAENLAALRCKAVIPVLIAGLEAELRRKRDPWAMDMRLHRLLEGLTGQKVLPGSARPWRGFWRREGRTFRFGSRERPAGGAARTRGARAYEKFFSIDIESDRVLFVLDFSGSMAEPVRLATRTTSARPGETMSKARHVVEELKKVVMALPDGTLFNVIVFSDDVRVWREERDGRIALVRLDDEARDDLLGSYLDSLHPAGATNLYGALDRALDFAGRGLWDRWYGLSFDTLYVLSDGAPSAGEVIDKEEILRLVRETNRLRRLTIHTITFGDRNDTRFLKVLAEENGGRHVHVD